MAAHSFLFLFMEELLCPSCFGKRKASDNKASYMLQKFLPPPGLWSFECRGFASKEARMH